MPIVGGLDIHRKQLTFDYLDTLTGEVRRGQIAPADRAHLRGWLARFAGRDDVAFAVEGCTGWRYVSEELAAAGIAAYVGESADTATARGRKRHAKTDKTDSRHLRVLLAEGPAARVLDSAGADLGVPGAAGDLSRPAPRAHRLGAAHPGERGLGVLALGLRDMGRAAPHAVHADGRGDRLPDLPCAGFIGALPWRCEQRAGSGGADAEVIRRGRHRRPPWEVGAVTSRRGLAGQHSRLSRCGLLISQRGTGMPAAGSGRRRCRTGSAAAGGAGRRARSGRPSRSAGGRRW